MSECHFCGHPVAAGTRIFRTSICDGCGKELKICLNCEFYAPGYQWDCRETIRESVPDKDRTNFCDFFRPSAKRHGGSPPGPEQKARNRFDDLFS